MASSLIIVADENIPFVREAFGRLGRVRVIVGRAMTSAAVKDADILLVRSITKVNESLLAGSKVKMVATATIGTDHIDEEYLGRSGIRFVSAAGSNANSVAEYVTAALLTVAQRDEFELEGRVIGIVGVGNVGSKVAAKCRALGMDVLKNDPPLKETSGTDEFIELDELLAVSDMVTLHVPLTVVGRWPTVHMAGAEFFKSLRPGTLLINSSRGSVVDGSALGGALWSGRTKAVLDVWENEPAIDVQLLGKVALGTPHIAGYSFDGKVNGTEMIYRAACEFLGAQPTWDPRLTMPAAVVPLVSIDPEDCDDQQLIRRIVRRVYDIEADDRNLRELLTIESTARGKYFDQLRKQYSIRREFSNTAIEFTSPPSAALTAKLSALGFKVHMAGDR